MHLTKLFISAIFILAICMACAGSKDANVAGTYVSIKPGNIDRIGIMYSRGYFKFAYIQADKDTLRLNDDSTFMYSKTYLDGERKRFEGSWDHRSGHISLQYSDTLQNENTSFKIAKKKIYSVHNISLCGSGEKKHLLDLFKKQ